MPLSELFVVVLTTLCALAIATWWVVRPSIYRTPARPETDPRATLIFEDGVFSHASRMANTHFGLEPGIDEWEDFQATISDTFPQFPDRPEHGSEGVVVLKPEGSAQRTRAHVAWRDGVARIVISDPEDAVQPTALDPETTRELEALRRMNSYLPDPVWQTDATGRVIWHNPSYSALYHKLRNKKPCADTPLFDLGPEALPVSENRRVVLKDKDGSEQGCYTVSRREKDEVSVFTASCIDAVVRAEETQRNFVQTMAKTFAHLSIGLAIFDRNQQLVLFNPALLDLTGLKAEFLSRRPNVLSFFDGLRENRRMPEPKNYSNWRDSISELFAAATDGRYQETWSLETGQTYRVTGSPHPDGATAFLIEDISAEVTLTRNFRAELEMGQSLLDTLDEGLAVFTASGVQTFSNKFYCELWQLDLEASFADVTVNDAINAWKQSAQSITKWQEIKDYIMSYGDRDAWDLDMELKGGRRVTCQLVPIASGATLLRFRVTNEAVEPAMAMTA